MFGVNPAGYNAATTAGNVGAGYGASSSGVNANLLPFLTRELNNPQGYTQQQLGAQLGAASAGLGGATGGLETEANLANARNRNSGGFSGALDQAMRDKGKTMAGISEGIAAKNADLQQTQQQEAAKGLAGMQEMDTNAQLKAMGLIAPDLNAQSALNKTSGWASQLQDVLGDVGAGLKIAGGFGIPGFGGFGK